MRSSERRTFHWKGKRVGRSGAFDGGGRNGAAATVSIPLDAE